MPPLPSPMISIPHLRSAIKGRVISPDDAGYDEARTVFVGGIDRRPAVIVRVADVDEVARIVSLSRQTGLELAVRSGGHSNGGYGVSDGGIVLDLRDMKALEISADRETAWAQTGFTAAEYSNAVGVHGLATGFGDTGSMATPIVDMLRPMPYPEIYPPNEADYHPMAAVRTLFTDAIGSSEAETVVGHLGSSAAAMRVAQIRVLGGAMARVPADATAFAHRGRRIMVNVAALYEQPDEMSTHETWVRAFAATLRQGEPAAYVNFLADEGEGRIREAYPPSTWDRLAAIKRRYDPTNLFRLNQNIPPVGA